MIDRLLEKLFTEIKNEKDNDNKTKNGISIYFVEKILEEQFKKPNYISSKTIKGYYEKYVEKRENKSGEPNSELKNIISNYLGYQDFLDFETKNLSIIGDSDQTKSTFITKKNIIVSSVKKWGIPAIISATIASGFYISGGLNTENCIVWKNNHYEKIDCNSKIKNISINNNIDIENFKMIKASLTTTFFIKDKPVIWYGKSINGEFEYFNSRGVHPITGKELKPVTQYIINKYVHENE